MLASRCHSWPVAALLQGGTGGGESTGGSSEGGDRNDSLLDPTMDPDTTWGDMSEGKRSLALRAASPFATCLGFRAQGLPSPPVSL